MAKPGRKRVYGDDITISVTPIDKRQLRAWARKDGITLPELFAAMIKLESRRRSHQVAIVVI